jgi:hypothetical protein
MEQVADFDRPIFKKFYSEHEALDFVKRLDPARLKNRTIRASVQRAFQEAGSSYSVAEEAASPAPHTAAASPDRDEAAAIKDLSAAISSFRDQMKSLERQMSALAMQQERWTSALKGLP